MKLSVLQWNVWYRERADAVLGEIGRLNADVVCLQELCSRTEAEPARNLVQDIAALGYVYRYEPTLHRPDRDMGNGIFSRFPITGSRTVYVQQAAADAHDPTRENRAYVEITVGCQAGAITVGTAHLSYSTDFLSTPEKNRETDRLLAAVASNTQRFILTGDLNALPGSYAVKQLGKQLRPAGPPYNEPTWTTKPDSYDFPTTGLDRRFDYVFVTPDVHLVDSRTISTNVSDHLPILTELEV